MPRPIRLFSMVFNEPYLYWFDRACMRSLCWPKNFEALRRVVAWDLWTTQEDAPRVLDIARRLDLQIELWPDLPPASWADKEHLKLGLTAALTAQIERCAAEGSAFLWIAPDSIFGDGSIASFFELGTPANVCIATAPLRVCAEGFIEAMHDPMSNAQLVRLGMARAHQAFLEAEARRPITNSFDSGVSWRELRPGLYAVTHRKHSAYFNQPRPSDVRWFQGMKKFGSFDHSYPRQLVDEQRQRVIGSSDAAFVVELTPSESHRAALYETDPDEPDRFNQDMSHHRANRNVVAIWRAA